MWTRQKDTFDEQPLFDQCQPSLNECRPRGSSGSRCDLMSPTSPAQEQRSDSLFAGAGEGAAMQGPVPHPDPHPNGPFSAKPEAPCNGESGAGMSQGRIGRLGLNPRAEGPSAVASIYSLPIPPPLPLPLVSPSASPSPSPARPSLSPYPPVRAPIPQHSVVYVQPPHPSFGSGSIWVPSQTYSPHVTPGMPPYSTGSAQVQSQPATPTKPSSSPGGTMAPTQPSTPTMPSSSPVGARAPTPGSLLPSNPEGRGHVGAAGRVGQLLQDYNTPGVWERWGASAFVARVEVDKLWCVLEGNHIIKTVLQQASITSPSWFLLEFVCTTGRPSPCWLIRYVWPVMRKRPADAPSLPALTSSACLCLCSA